MTDTKLASREAAPQARRPAAPDEFAVDRVVTDIRAAAEPKRSWWPELDELGIRFQSKELTLIGARTGHGKTTALVNLLASWLEHYTEERFLYYTYEIPIDALLLKMAALVIRKQTGTTWSFYELREFVRKGTVPEGLSADDVQQALDTVKQWEHRLTPVYIPDLSADQLSEHAQQAKATAGNIGGVLVDYVQLVPAPPGRYERRDVEVSAVARTLKRLSVNIACPVVAAAQMSREAIGQSDIPRGRPFDALPVQEAIQKRRPQLHHLREGGSEQEADLVIGLLNYRADFVSDREDASRDDRNRPGPLDVSILKNRYGDLGVVTMVLDGRSGLIRGLSFREKVEAEA